MPRSRYGGDSRTPVVNRARRARSTSSHGDGRLVQRSRRARRKISRGDFARESGGAKWTRRSQFVDKKTKSAARSLRGDLSPKLCARFPDLEERREGGQIGQRRRGGTARGRAPAKPPFHGGRRRRPES